MQSRFATLRQIPKGVWVVGGVSMLMDISSEIIHSLLPLFMVTTLGASVIFIGLIEGLAEATALFIKTVWNTGLFVPLPELKRKNAKPAGQKK